MASCPHPVVDTDAAFSVEERSGLEINGPIPIYHQLHQILKRRIVSGQLAVGDLLPSENQIAKEFGISRVPVARAFHLLAKENLVEQFRGIGTRVIDDASEPVSIGTLSESFGSPSLLCKNAITKVLVCKHCYPSPRIATAMHCDATERVHFILQLRLDTQQRPFAYLESWTRYLPSSIRKEAFENGSRTDILAGIGQSISRAEQSIGAIRATDPVAAYLQLLANDPILTVNRRSFGSTDDVVDLQFGLYHPGRFQYNTSVSNPSVGT